MEYFVVHGHDQSYSQNQAELITKQINPDNKETPINFIDKNLTDDRVFYQRNHFEFPEISRQNFGLDLIVESPEIRTRVEYESIISLPSRTLMAILECAGDKRLNFKKKSYGLQWGDGAISYGKWKGVPLYILLKQLGEIDYSDIKEIIFTGYDRGKRLETGDTVPYAKSLPLKKALDKDTIIAYEFNDGPLPFKHGYPLRLIVPGWYGMDSVKWLKSIKLVNHKFKGPFQLDYSYKPRSEESNHTKKSIPVTTINVNSTIQKPLNYSNHSMDQITVIGLAWSGLALIKNVKISLDGGDTWHFAELDDQESKYSWVNWIYRFQPKDKGHYTIMVKATDYKERTQPDKPFENADNYGYNAISKVHINVVWA